MVHKDALQVDKARLLEDLLAQHPHVVVRHPQDLYLMVQVGGHSSESGSSTIRFPFPYSHFFRTISFFFPPGSGTTLKICKVVVFFAI